MVNAVPVSTLERKLTDAVTADAVDDARTALLDEVGANDVGDYLGHEIDGLRVVTHHFDCARKGYRGWQWAVTLTRASRQRKVTVVEVVLLPGDEAIIAPAWVPYRERLQPGDMSPGDLLPVDDDDARLVPTYSFGDDPLDTDEKTQVREVAKDLGLGRVRTLSPEGRDRAAERWYDGDAGPEAAIAKSAPHSCHSCGFLVRLAGPLSEMFGVCANGDANDDARVVAHQHGCGAHSEVRLTKRQQAQPPAPPVIDTISLDDLEVF
ncbi:hypothetical protein ASE01_06535 [Nocardioides sp. Root190]|uniref:DUF3027 domain-containing protein n=1 Tax=Nocardioides sp. Root190 TaxID=1736488 RepID=UPI0006FAFED3|nr:hypothetical protein ASE01_06535 [Nocardioides sp. Root190]